MLYVLILVVGVWLVMWAINRAYKLDPLLRRVVYAILGLIVVLWLIDVLGLIPPDWGILK